MQPCCIAGPSSAIVQGEIHVPKNLLKYWESMGYGEKRGNGREGMQRQAKS